MLLAVTIVCGLFLGWAAGREGILAVAPPTVGVVGALTLVGYLRFLLKNWRMTWRRFSTHGSRVVRREALSMLAWSLLFRLLVMATAGVLGYWISVILQ